ncbi:MAG: DNA-directed RNA polymerase subunit A', partial [Nanoarchaeota archaeon]|nr:DNA-directed RNA polymerase subunit A' [Nanoarchaeota archaeon]
MKLDSDFISNKIAALEFGILSPRIIEKMSSVAITSSELYDIDGLPVDGGLEDLRLGVTDPGLVCKTCGNSVRDCPGHFGHLELARPVFNIKMVPIVHNLLNATCDVCGRILIPESTLKKISDRLEEIEAQEGITAKENYIRKIIKHAKNVMVCPFCHARQSKVKLERPYTFKSEGQILTPVDVMERLERIKDSDLKFFGMDPDSSRPEWMIITVLPIPPVTIRPPITLETGQRSEDDLTHKLTDIVRTNQRLAENIKSGAPEVIIDELWDLLQYHVTTLISNDTAQVPVASQKSSGKKLRTLEDRIKGKEGRFRGSTLGKRVNFSARSVISPDPFLKLDEVGVPLVIARDLTYPERVTDINLERVKGYIKNFNSYPGANYIVTPDGIRKKITEANVDILLDEVKPGYIVERHLLNGDVVIFNRQPSLHRLSLMGHSVRVLPQRTLSVNPTSTLPYNADFDGDEMNIHLLQNEEAKAEATLIMDIKNNIVSPRHGLPLIGATQDYLSGCAILTKKETVLDASDVGQLLAMADVEVNLTKKKYTGREVFSMLLPEDLNFEGESKVYKSTGDDDAYVRIKNGKLVTGVIDSEIIGRESGSLLQYLFVRYGGSTTATLINRIVKLSLMVLMKFGISVNPGDFDLPENAYKLVDDTISEAEKDVDSLLKKYDRNVENQILAITEKVRGEARNIVRKYIKTEGNTINEMMITGAKG